MAEVYDVELLAMSRRGPVRIQTRPLYLTGGASAGRTVTAAELEVDPISLSLSKAGFDGLSPNGFLGRLKTNSAAV